MNPPHAPSPRAEGCNKHKLQSSTVANTCVFTLTWVWGESRTTRAKAGSTLNSLDLLEAQQWCGPQFLATRRIGQTTAYGKSLHQAEGSLSLRPDSLSLFSTSAPSIWQKSIKVNHYRASTNTVSRTLKMGTTLSPRIPVTKIRQKRRECGGDIEPCHTNMEHALYDRPRAERPLVSS